MNSWFDHIALKFVEDQYIVLASVCRQWRKILSKTKMTTSLKFITSRVELLEIAVTCPEFPIDLAFEAIVRSGYEESLKYAIKNKWSIDWVIMKAALDAGRLSTLNMLRDGGMIDRNVLFVSDTCHTNVIEWLVDNEFLDSKCVCSSVAFSNNFDKLKWAYEKGYGLSECVPIYAARNGNIDMLEWVAERGYAPTSDARRYARKHNRIDALNWIDEYWENRRRIHR